ncbi:MAG: hypothetical protein K6F91_05150 [Ruminococcus sp.]|nr:hypothetical protein [Ruminococcus sp.]
MKKTLDLICVIMFFTIIVMFAMSTLFFGSKPVSLSLDTQKTDEALIAQFPLQRSWKTLRTTILLAAGKTEIDGSFLINEGVIKPSEPVSSKATQRLTDALNAYAAKTSGKSIFACIVPSCSGIYSADIPSVGVGFDQKHYISEAYSALDPSIATLDAYSPLYTSREDYIFMRTDSALTSRGAFDIYSSNIRKMGFSPRPFSDYDCEHAMIGYIGSLCSELSIRQRITPDNIELLIPKNGTVVTSATGWYGSSKEKHKSVYDRDALLGDKPLDVFVYGSRYKKLDISTLSRDNPRLLIVKTEHTNPIIPFILSHYSFITVIDADTAASQPLDELVSADDYDQILFLIDIDHIEELGLDEFLGVEE